MKPVMGIVLLVVMLLAILSIVLHQGNTPNQALSLAQDVPADPTQNSVLPPVEAKPNSPRGPIAPEIVSDTWLNSAPLSAGDLRGKVVVVEFWTFDCINCRNTIPQVRSWYSKYHDQGLLVIGAHSPEFSYEHDVTNVKNAIKDLSIPYAVALDNGFKNWNAFRVWAWPTIFIIDKQGALRFTHVGEGAYAEAEQTIVGLLKE
jgi:thiol-disulfide isomerase/thioredoxin